MGSLINMLDLIKDVSFFGMYCICNFFLCFYLFCYEDIGWVIEFIIIKNVVNYVRFVFNYFYMCYLFFRLICVFMGFFIYIIYEIIEVIIFGSRMISVRIFF